MEISAELAATSPAESPLSPVILKSLGDRNYERRKTAALEIEALIKQLKDMNDTDRICSIVAMLGQDFTTSTNANYRKGGLIGLAGAAIGLAQSTRQYLDALLPPVLHCFDDPEARVRYYACESLYNIAKVARGDILVSFNELYDGICKLYADADQEVKSGANLLDRLIKDIVTESDSFDIEKFIPLLQKHIRRTNPYVRQLLVGWITVLDSVPDIHMIDWLPDFLDGLLNMLSDTNREIRQAADSALKEFLKEIRQSEFVDFGPMVPILVSQCSSKEKLCRQTAIEWVSKFIGLGADRLIGFYSEMLGAIMHCISDHEQDIRQIAAHTNAGLLETVRETKKEFELAPLLATLSRELLSHHVPTRLAALRWINMLVEKKPSEMSRFIADLLPALLKTLSDDSDDVVLLNLQVLGQISHDEREFQRVLPAILGLFAADRRLLEARGSLIIRRLCVMLDAKNIYISLASALQPNKTSGQVKLDLEFVSLMIQTLNLILLTATELEDLREALKASFVPTSTVEARDVFTRLFDCWCHNPVSTFSLCLLAQAYDLAAQLVRKFVEVEITVGFLMQIDKLVQLLESPIFMHLRMQLLEVDAPCYPSLVKALYGLLMLLPQSTAYNTLSSRLSAGCSLHQTLCTGNDSRNQEKRRDSTKADQTFLSTFDTIQRLHSNSRKEHSGVKIQLQS